MKWLGLREEEVVVEQMIKPIANGVRSLGFNWVLVCCAVDSGRLVYQQERLGRDKDWSEFNLPQPKSATITRAAMEGLG